MRKEHAARTLQRGGRKPAKAGGEATAGRALEVGDVAAASSSWATSWTRDTVDAAIAAAPSTLAEN
eukprot:36032-Prymnesium_polylepis.1